MDADLIGYLLNALDPATRRQVDAYLRQNAAARARLAQLEKALAPLAEDAQPDEAPPGLTEATLAQVERLSVEQLPAAPKPSPHQVGGPNRWWPRPIDLAVAAALLLVVAGLGGPRLVAMWRQEQQTACANNLRRFWTDLHVFANNSGHGAFPEVEAEGPRGMAGVFVPKLHDAGLLREATVTCPAQLPCDAPVPSLENLENLHRRHPEHFQKVAGVLAGSYAYCLGYREEGGAYRGLRQDSGDHLPIMADRCGPGRCNSQNHGIGGQNVLFVGGNVRWCTRPNVGENGDDIFLNRNLEVSAGLGRADTVLGSSGDRP
jgi:hypothetical protein